MQQVLITDETGEILETDRANVFAVIDGVLLTPPADGRLLPGTTRAAVMRAARDRGIRVGQKPLTLDELASATEVFVTNAVVGVLPVAAVDGLPRHLESRARSPRPSPPPWPPAARPEPDAATSPTPSAPPAPSHLVGAPRTAPAQHRVGHRACDRPGPRHGRPAARRPHRQLRLVHLEPRAPPVHRGAQVEVVRNDEVTAAQVAARARRAW